MSARDNEHAVPLMSQEERDEGKQPLDLEANGSAEAVKAQNLDHEYSIPSTIKFAWLGVYFIFSLALTLHNKLVLGSVSLTSCASWPLDRQFFSLVDCGRPRMSLMIPNADPFRPCSSVSHGS